MAGVVYITAYAYDAADTLKGITYPSGDTATYQLNALGQVSEIDAVIGGSAKTLASGIQYLPFGSWTRLTLGNGVITTRAFDTDYRIGSIVSGSVLSRSYGYDQRNNITSITDALRPGRTQALTYDAIGELTNATGIYGSLGYFYNGSSGDRTRATAVLPANTNYIYPTTSHKLSSTSGLLGPTNYSYDPAGNLTGKGTTTYTFNNAGRLAAISGSGSPQYLYNAIGQRVEKTVTSGLLGGVHTSTVFSYDQSGLLLREGTATGALGSEYFYIYGEPLALYTQPATLLGPGPAQVYYYHNDHLGTPQFLTNSSGTTSWSADYQPFGTVTLRTQTITNNLRLPGQYSDSESGLYQNWHRDFDPDTGRYIESDPLGFAGGINTYAYVENDPVTLYDPAGLAKLGPKFRWRTCSQLEEGQCKAECESRGKEYESCRARVMITRSLRGDSVVPEIQQMPNSLSCSCKDKNNNTAFCALAASVAYYIISEGSRILFPPRNLLPIP